VRPSQNIPPTPYFQDAGETAPPVIIAQRNIANNPVTGSSLSSSRCGHVKQIKFDTARTCWLGGTRCPNSDCAVDFTARGLSAARSSGRSASPRRPTSSIPERRSELVTGPACQWQLGWASLGNDDCCVEALRCQKRVSTDASCSTSQIRARWTQKWGRPVSTSLVPISSKSGSQASLVSGRGW
jgi:hypothetical protein